MANFKRDILKNIGEIDREEYFDQIDEHDEVMSNAVEAEARLIQAFSNMMREVKSLKYLVNPKMGVPWGSEDMDSPEDYIKAKKTVMAVRAKLKNVVSEKMPILHEIIDDVLGPTEKEIENKEEMEREGPPMHKHKKVVIVKNTDYDEDEEGDE